MTTATDTSIQCSLTNMSGKDITLIVAVPENESASNGATVSANGHIEVLKTTDGSSIIKNNSSGTVTLDHTYKPGSNQNGNVQHYDLLVCDPAWLYPLAVIPVVQQLVNGTTGYAPQTVTMENAALSQATAFYQNISAYPGSGLAKDYAAALQAATAGANAKADGSQDAAAAAASAVEQALTAFFKSTTEYQEVTLAGIVAVDDYYNAIPAIWAQYKNSLTYYLYGSNGITAGFAGTLTLQKSGSVDVDQPNSGYACTFTPAINQGGESTDVDSSGAVTLTYANGVFLNDPAAAPPKIALKGSFMQAALLTGDDENKEIIMMLSGNINGVLCVGFNTPQTGNAVTPRRFSATAASTEADNYWDTLVHPKSQKDFIVSILTLVGAVLLFPAAASALYGIYRVVKYKLGQKEPLTRDSVQGVIEDNVRNTRERINSWPSDDTVSEISNDSDGLFTFSMDTGDSSIRCDAHNIRSLAQKAQNIRLANRLIEGLELHEESLAEISKYESFLDGRYQKLIHTAYVEIEDAKTALITASDNLKYDADKMDEILKTQLKTCKEIGDTLVRVTEAVMAKTKGDFEDTVYNNVESKKIYEKVEDTLEEQSKPEAREGEWIKPWEPEG